MAVANSTTPVKIVALGGLGEIGLNLLVLECNQSAIIIDAGVMFAEERELGVGLLLPDLSYLDQSRLNLEGIVLTHAHEDISVRSRTCSGAFPPRFTELK